jgi:hypothetical protein
MKPSESIIQPKRPKGKGWIKGPPVPAFVTKGYPAESWKFPERDLRVISAVEVTATEPGGEPLGPEYHISISRGGPRGESVRCSSQEAKWVLRQFDLEDAEEDNHVPNGVVRNFWRPVADRLSGYQCPCKDAEPAMIEDGGDFVWRGVTR